MEIETMTTLDDLFEYRLKDVLKSMNKDRIEINKDEEKEQSLEDYVWEYREEFGEMVLNDLSSYSGTELYEEIEEA
jgi:hypothetical protein